MKNHSMNSGMSLFLFYVSDYADESRYKLQFLHSLLFSLSFLIFGQLGQTLAVQLSWKDNLTTRNGTHQHFVVEIYSKILT